MTARDALDWIAFVVGLGGLIAIFAALRSLWQRIALRLPRCRSKARGRIEVLRRDTYFLWNRHPEAAHAVPRSLHRRIRENEQVLESLFKNEAGVWVRFSCLFREDPILHLLGKLESDMRLVIRLLEDAGYGLGLEGFETQGASLPSTGAFPISLSTSGTISTNQNMPGAPTSGVSNSHEDEILTQIPVTDTQPPTVPSTELTIDRYAASTVQNYDITYLHLLTPDAQLSSPTSVGVRRRRREKYREDPADGFKALPPDLQSQMRALASGLAEAGFVAEHKPEPAIGSAEANALLNAVLPHRWDGEAHQGRSLWTVFLGVDGRCLWCGYARKGNVINHVRVHFGHRPFACNQQHTHSTGKPCQRRYHSQKLLDDHKAWEANFKAGLAH